MNAQFKKGIIELLVLKTIADESQTAFEVISILGAAIDVNENTIYPILRRLTKQEYFITEKVPSTLGAPRKIYKITDKGKTKLTSYKEEWETFLAQVFKILGGQHVK